MIPFFGHTFNEDAWSPHAEQDYFKIGEAISYIPSRAWLSSFIVHDDNLGPNLCIPQGFLDKAKVDYVLELLPQGWRYSGVEAELVAADYFYSILPELADSLEKPWLRRLLEYVIRKKLILRHVPIGKNDYLAALRRATDWEGRAESTETLSVLEDLVPERYWMIEVSVPEVFSTNKRKLGEILLDAERELSSDIDGTSFVLARFPGCYAFFDQQDGYGIPRFSTTSSSLESHIPVYSVGS